MENILILGEAIFRNKKIPFGIKRNDRFKHIYIIGKTGHGKTTLLENMIIQDIENDQGLVYLDAHGDSVQKILDFIPKKRISDVIYFNTVDIEHPFAFNPLEKVSWEHRHLIALGLLNVFKKIWVDVWSARMEYILTNTLLALLEWPKATLLDVNRMLADENFRRKVVNNLRDPVVKEFWLKEFEKYHLYFRTEAVASIQNKVGQFATNPLIRNIIAQPESSFNLREIMDSKKVLLINLSVGAIGEETASLLGGLLITKLQISAMGRVDLPEEKRNDFYLYADEFQNFATESFIDILAEARKYRLGLILSHQYLDQIDEKIIKAILGNVGTIITFRVGARDAEILLNELDYNLKTDDLINLPAYHTYVKLLIDDIPTRPFLAKTLPPKTKTAVSYKEEIITLNHLQYAKSRNQVELMIKNTYLEPFELKKSPKRILTACQNCRQLFYYQDENHICQNCQNQIKTGFSLKKAVEKEILIEKTKQDSDNKNENKLDKILKKLQQPNKES